MARGDLRLVPAFRVNPRSGASIVAPEQLLCIPSSLAASLEGGRGAPWARLVLQLPFQSSLSVLLRRDLSLHRAERRMSPLRLEGPPLRGRAE